MKPFLERFCPAAAAAGRPAAMGIVNATPDSFSDGGAHATPEAAVAWARGLVAAGADLLDVGAESTRPGYAPVPADEEERRLVPVVAALRAALPGVPISADTRKASVARAALDAGADIVNDVSSLEDPDMAALVRERGAGLVLMNGWPEHNGAPRDAAPGGLADIHGGHREHHDIRAAAGLLHGAGKADAFGNDHVRKPVDRSHAGEGLRLGGIGGPDRHLIAVVVQHPGQRQSPGPRSEYSDPFHITASRTAFRML